MWYDALLRESEPPRSAKCPSTIMSTPSISPAFSESALEANRLIGEIRFAIQQLRDEDFSRVGAYLLALCGSALDLSSATGDEIRLAVTTEVENAYERRPDFLPVIRDLLDAVGRANLIRRQSSLR